MLRIGLVTYAGLPDLTEDDRLLQHELVELGARAEAVVWDDPRVPWESFDSLVLRSSWDYHLKPAEFLSWLARLDVLGVPLWNPTALVRWNLQKTYLRDLAKAGVPVLPTVWLERGSALDLAKLLAERDWTEAIVKPDVSASAFRTALVSRADAPHGQAILDDILANSGALVQRFSREVRDDGE